MKRWSKAPWPQEFTDMGISRPSPLHENLYMVLVALARTRRGWVIVRAVDLVLSVRNWFKWHVFSRKTRLADADAYEHVRGLRLGGPREYS